VLQPSTTQIRARPNTRTGGSSPTARRLPFVNTTMLDLFPRPTQPKPCWGSASHLPALDSVGPRRPARLGQDRSGRQCTCRSGTASHPRPTVRWPTHTTHSATPSLPHTIPAIGQATASRTRRLRQRPDPTGSLDHWTGPSNHQLCVGQLPVGCRYSDRAHELRGSHRPRLATVAFRCPHGGHPGAATTRVPDVVPLHPAPRPARPRRCRQGS
jgi:hypothetical protein